MALLTNARFLRYQDTFYRTVAQCDKTIEIGIESVSPTGDFLEGFVGAGTRTITWHTFPALYQTDIDSYSRDRFGLSSTESGLIYLSPKQLIPVFGTYRIDRLATHVRKSDHEFILDKVNYLEPLYESCVAIELTLKDIVRG